MHLFSAVTEIQNSLVKMSNQSLPRVLLVDDCSISTHRTCDQLLHWRIRPTIASDGMRAVKLVNKQEFDLILMDISMPVMDGLEATAQVRQFERLHPDRSRQSIVAHTSGSINDHALWRKIGIDAVLRKPCDVQTLEACLKQWCRNFYETSTLVSDVGKLNSNLRS